jgi:hypothetical protein
MSPLDAGLIDSRTTAVTIPATARPGVYYLAACADDGAVLSESNETNSCRGAWIQVR